MIVLRSPTGHECRIDVSDDGTVAGQLLDAAMRETGTGPWTVIERHGETARYLGLIDRTLVSQSGARLCDVDRPIGMRFQLLGQVTPARREES